MSFLISDKLSMSTEEEAHGFKTSTGNNSASLVRQIRQKWLLIKKNYISQTFFSSIHFTAISRMGSFCFEVL